MGPAQSRPDLTTAPRVAEVAVSQADGLRLVTVRVRDADKLRALRFQRITYEVYSTIRRALSIEGVWHPIRFWNVIPDLHQGEPDEMDRYMVFNAGRYAAYFDWYAGESGFAASIATATGVGHDGEDLIVHVLASDRAGTPIENPRQIESYHYSARYGPLPPCFARATIAALGTAPTSLLLGGTSSVRGESSVGAGDVEGQTRETIENLAYLIRAGRGHDMRESLDTADVSDELSRLRSLRVYYTSPEHLPRICALIAPYVTHLGPSCVDLVCADICRRELLVEIEGVAAIAA